MMSSLSFMLLLLIVGLLSIVSAYPRLARCHKDTIQTQNNFNMTKLLGKWYLISDYNVDGLFLTNFIDFDDIQARFYQGKNKDVKIETGKHNFTKCSPSVQFPL